MPTRRISNKLAPVTHFVFAAPTFQRPTGTDLSRMRGDAERVGATMRAVIERELEHKTTEARS